MINKCYNQTTGPSGQKVVFASLSNGLCRYSTAKHDPDELGRFCGSPLLEGQMLDDNNIQYYKLVCKFPVKLQKFYKIKR